MKIKAIKGSYAFVIYTLEDIEPDEAITVCYTDDRTYFEGGKCLCQSCHPDRPEIAAGKKRAADHGVVLVHENKKRVRRGGRRSKARQKLQSCGGN